MLLCDNCKKEFAPSKEQMEFISTAQDKGMNFIMLECPMTRSSPTEENCDDALKCPKETCYGYVSYIDDEPPFGGVENVVMYGLKLSYIDYGNEGKPILLCLHGTFGNARTFANVATALTDWHIRLRSTRT